MRLDGRLRHLEERLSAPTIATLADLLAWSRSGCPDPEGVTCSRAMAALAEECLLDPEAPGARGAEDEDADEPAGRELLDYVR